MSSPLPRPGRRSPAGLGSVHSTASSAADQLRSIAPDMERALGALRDFTRRDILLRFYADRRPRTVEDVAKATGIHRSVAFDHLERLVALGYLEVERRRGLPGKPAKIYQLTAGPLQISHPIRRYDVLAEALARSFEPYGDGDGREAFKQAGRALGLSLAVSGADSLTDVLEPMSEMGADYEVRPGGRIDCLNCLFAEVCQRVPEICSFHAGVIEGLMGPEDRESEVKSLGVREEGGCAFFVAS